MRRDIFSSNPGATVGALAVTVRHSTELALVGSQDPASVYLASLARGSRRTMRGALRRIAQILLGIPDELQVPWHVVDYAHASAVRTKLAQSLAPATVNRILAALRGVLKAAFKLGLISSDRYARAAMIEPVRGSRSPKGRSLSSGELQALFEICNPSTTAGSRNAALLALMFGAGLRRSEIVALDLESFERSSGKLVVRGKGGKHRIGWITNGSLQALEAWLAQRGDAPGPLFFPVLKGGSIVVRRLTDGAVAELVHRLAKKAKIASFAPHDARRSFISSLLSLGADLALTQQLAGHASPVTTSRYDRRPEHARRRAAELLQIPFVRF